MILHCGCQRPGQGSLYQDNHYGGGKRVHNRCKDAGAGAPQARCSVCGNLRNIRSPEKAKAKVKKEKP